MLQILQPMLPENSDSKKPDNEGKLPVAPTGNASNPPAGKDEPAGRQSLPGKAEKYIRESGNIEDLPDAEEEDLPDAEEKGTPGK